MIGRCLNCPVMFVDVRNGDTMLEAFAAHQRAHNSAGVPSPAAPLPTTHGSVSVERGTFARPADGIDPARHPSAGRRPFRGGGS